MAETSGFYDAEELVNGDYDREYVSEQFAQYFALFIGNGVYASPTNQLKVVAGEGMNIIVKEGWAFIKGRWYHNDSDLVIPVPPNTTAATINSGVFVQHSQSDRDIHSILATGRTTPDREAPYWELKIAELQIPTGTTAITDAMITDTRTDESVCGFVKNLLQGVIPTADLFAQYNAIFMDFYNHIKDQLSEDAAGHLQVEIDKNTKDISDVDGRLTQTNYKIEEIQSQIVPTASIESGATASKAYSVGDFLVKDGTLYKATKAIAKDDALTVGDNIASETIAEGLNSIQTQIVPTASIEVGETASKAYSDDDYLVKDGILYKVTTAIAEGDALTVGTNIAMTTVGCELSSINERLLRYKTIRFDYYYTEIGKVVKLKLKDIVKDLGLYAFVDGSTYLETTDALGYHINLPIGCTINSNSGYASCYIEFSPSDSIINSMNICFYSGRLEGDFYVILHYLPIE